MMENAFVGRMNPTPEKQVTALDALNDRYRSLHAELHGQCGRIDCTLQRLMPQPQPPVTGGDGAKTPGAVGALHRLENTANDMEGTLSWLRDLAARLERIA